MSRLAAHLAAERQSPAATAASTPRAKTLSATVAVVVALDKKTPSTLMIVLAGTTSALVLVSRLSTMRLHIEVRASTREALSLIRHRTIHAAPLGHTILHHATPATTAVVRPESPRSIRLRAAETIMAVGQAPTAVGQAPDVVMVVMLTTTFANGADSGIVCIKT